VDSKVEELKTKHKQAEAALKSKPFDEDMARE